MGYLSKTALAVLETSSLKSWLRDGGLGTGPRELVSLQILSELAVFLTTSSTLASVRQGEPGWLLWFSELPML